MVSGVLLGRLLKPFVAVTACLGCIYPGLRESLSHEITDKCALPENTLSLKAEQNSGLGGKKQSSRKMGIPLRKTLKNEL